MTDLDTLRHLHEATLQLGSEYEDMRRVVKAGAAEVLEVSNGRALGFEDATRQSIADALGISRQRVSQWIAEHAASEHRATSEEAWRNLTGESR